MSLDVGLAHNALELVLEEGNYLISDVFFHEYNQSDLMVLFATASTAYRLVLPHPEKVAKVRHSNWKARGREICFWTIPCT